MDDNEQAKRQRDALTINRVVHEIYDSFEDGVTNPLEHLSPELTVVLLCAGFLDYHELGGIYDWYYNPYGEFASETVTALDRLGCTELARVLHDVLNRQLSCEKLSQLQRGDLVRRICEEDLDRIDQKLTELRGAIPERLAVYIAEHEL